MVSAHAVVRIIFCGDRENRPHPYGMSYTSSGKCSNGVGNWVKLRLSRFVNV